MKALRDKKKLADKVAGESLQGALDLVSGDMASDILSLMRQGFEGNKAGDPGTLLAKERIRSATKTMKAKPAPKKKEPKAKKEKSADFQDLPITTVDLDLSDI